MSLNVYFLFCFVFSAYFRVLNISSVQYLHLKQCLTKVLCFGQVPCFVSSGSSQWSGREVGSWPYRPPVSDDDEGITAVEATGGESVQLQRVQCAGVLTFYKQTEDWTADIQLIHLQDAPLLCGHYIPEIKQQKEFIHQFVLDAYSAYRSMLMCWIYLLYLLTEVKFYNQHMNICYIGPFKSAENILICILI